MNSTMINRTGCQSYIDACMDTIHNAENIHNRDSELLFGLTCNCACKNTEAVVIIVAPNAIMHAPCLQYHFSTWSDGITRWKGNAYDSVKNTLKGGVNAIRCTISLGVPYNEIDKDSTGTRAQAIEKAVSAGLASVYPSHQFEYEFGYDVVHIGNHRERGWRDVAIYAKATDTTPRTRIALIEVKSRAGRMI